MKKIISIIMLLYTFEILLANNLKHNMNFNNLSINEFIKISSKILEKNIFIFEKIEGKVDFVFQKDITKPELYELLEMTLNQKGYRLIKEGEILKILKIENEKKIIQNEVVEIIPLHNADASSIAKIIQNLFTQKLNNKNQNIPLITVDTQSNSLVIKAKIDDFEKINEIVKKLDANQMQVYVEAKIIELSENKTKDLGVRWGLSSVDISGNNIFTLGGNFGGSANALDPSISSLFSLAPATLSSAVALGATLNLLKENQVIDVVSEPSILSLNNKVSTIYVGETRSFQTSEIVTDGGNTNSTFQREDIGLTLKVKPRISTKNKVILEIEAILEDAKELRSEQTNPDTTKKEIKTTAIVSNAQSVILGGLIKNKIDQYNSAVPFLSEIPFLGEIFKYERIVKDKINLVVIVTPYIIPKAKDFEFIKKQLVELKKLEDEYTKKLKQRLINRIDAKTDELVEKREEDVNSTENEKKDMQKSSNKKNHTKMLNDYYGG